MTNQPTILKRQVHLDNRGEVLHYGSQALGGIQRLYVVRPSLEAGFRGWHGHKKEAKAFLCLSGSVRISSVRVDDWEKPTGLGPAESWHLDAKVGDLLVIPDGYANGIEPLEAGVSVLVMSNRTLKQSLDDDYRYPHDAFARQ